MHLPNGCTGHARGSDDALFTIFLEHGLLLPLLQHLELCGDVPELFFHLGKEGFDRIGLSLIAEISSIRSRSRRSEKPR